MCLRCFWLRSISGIKSRNINFNSWDTLTMYICMCIYIYSYIFIYLYLYLIFSVNLPYSQTFHNALLVKDITHFCYSRAWYKARLAQNSVIDCLLHTWNCDPRLNLLFISVLLDNWRQLKSKNCTYFLLGFYNGRGGRGSVAQLTLCVEGTYCLPVSTLVPKSRSVQCGHVSCQVVSWYHAVSSEFVSHVRRWNVTPRQIRQLLIVS